jgi:hypothetical protein
MAESPTRSSGSLSLEVWLGPMEGVRCAKAIGADPIVLRMGRRYADEARGTKNDLVLGDGERISGFHAEVRCSGGTLHLKDLNSTNGTYAGSRRVSGEVEIHSGDVFVLSTTPVQALITEQPKVSSEPPMSAGEISATASLQKMLAAARAAARDRGHAYVDTRHLADALLRSSDGAVESSLSAASLTSERALGELWTSKLLGGGRAWIHRFLEAKTEGGRPAEPVLTTRVNAIFGAAARRLAIVPGADASSQAPGALLSMLLESSGPVGPWLASHGVAGPRLTVERRSGRDRRQAIMSRISRTIRLDASEALAGFQPAAPPPAAVPPAPPKEVTGATMAAPAVVAAPAAPVVPAAPPMISSTGDVVLDQRARAIAQEIELTAALYRFSTPEDRRAAVKGVVSKALAAVAPENRTRILSQIRIQFPLLAASAAEPSPEVPELRRRIEELERQLAERKPPSAAATTDRRSAEPSELPWKDVFSEAQTPRGAPAEVAAVKELIGFAHRMEKFLLGMIQSVTMPGSTTTTFKLPSYRYTLEAVLTAMREGKTFDRERLPEYIRELERWQVAILAGHHAAAGVWFGQFWSKINPTAIEAAATKPATWKLQGGATDFWNRYREVVRGLSAEVVQDQVLQAAYRIAQDEYDKLTKRRAQ